MAISQTARNKASIETSKIGIQVFIKSASKLFWRDAAKASEHQRRRAYVGLGL